MLQRTPKSGTRRGAEGAAARAGEAGHGGCCSRPVATSAPLPEIVQIESTNICNAKCVFCPRDEMAAQAGDHGHGAVQEDRGRMRRRSASTHVRMHNYGEPFVDRALVEKVRYAKQKGIPQVGMISNGSLITEAAARGMIEAGLDAINISVDASGKEVFESTRVGLKYDKVIANIERLARLRDEQAGKRRPKLILSFVRQNNSEDEHAFIEHWRAIADKIHITDLHNWAGHAEPEVGRQLPVLSAVADVHGAVGRPGVALLRRLRRPHDPRRPAHPHDQRRSGTPSPTGPCAASTSRAAAPPSAGPATSHEKTRRSG